MLLFDFVVPGTPVSAQAHRGAKREAYKQRVSDAARAAWLAGQQVIASPVAVTITHFYDGAPADLDNISKLLLDGLKGVVIVDDSQINDLVLQRRPLIGPYVLASPTPVLTNALGLSTEFVHIAIASAPPHAELRPHDYP